MSRPVTTTPPASAPPPERDRHAAPEPSLGAELRSSALLFGLALLVTAGVSAGASLLVGLLS